MANYEATRYDFDAANLTGIQGVNTGIIVPWSDASIPSGFLECDGSAVSRSTYADLFAVVGTTYGVGDGSTTFNLPDLQGACCQNTSPTKAHGSSGGAATVASTGNVSVSLANYTLTTSDLAAHTHPFNAGGSSPGFPMGYVNLASSITTGGNTGGSGAHGHNATGSFVGDATSVLQPYITLVYIIKT